MSQSTSHEDTENSDEERKKQRIKEWANSDIPAAPVYREYYKKHYGEDPCT